MNANLNTIHGLITISASGAVELDGERIEQGLQDESVVADIRAALDVATDWDDVGELIVSE